MISAVVLTKNEGKNIKECLSGLKWCDEILVVDDDSDDKTIEMAERFGANVIKRSLNGDFAGQRNFGLKNTKGDWVLFVDADERVSKELADEIKESVKKDDVNGFYFRRIDNFMGKWLKHGEIGGIRILRLAKKSGGNWTRKVDEIWEIKGKIKTLKNPLLHYSHPTMTEFFTSINERSTLNAKEFYDGGRRITLIEWLKPKTKFIQNYFFRLGFLDGTQGFVFAVLMSLHSFLVRGKLYLLWQREKKDPPPLKLWRTGRRASAGSLEKGFFLIWAIFVFASYIYFLFQRGKNKW